MSIHVERVERVKTNREAIRGLGSSPQVYSDLNDRMGRVLKAAKAGAPSKTGKLKRSGRRQSGRNPEGTFYIDVVFSSPVLNYIIDGTPPHEIRPKGPGYPLRFYWAKVGAWVAFMKVSHPGTAPNDFLTPALEAAR